jgi:acetyl/propionyl-CoA carboxylase alpha subunit
LDTYKIPQGPGVRVDDGMEEGMEIPIFYDPMIAKLITYGKDRTEAIARMIRAIDEYEITGVQTTLAFCKFVMKHKAFVSGKFDTHFVKKYFNPEMLVEHFEDELEVAAMIAVEMLNNKKSKAQSSSHQPGNKSNWKNNRVELRD